jgi:ankyrin repeat protein
MASRVRDTPAALSSKSCVQQTNLTLRAFLAPGANIEARLAQDGVTPLFLAAVKGLHEMVRLLLDRGMSTSVTPWPRFRRFMAPF